MFGRTRKDAPTADDSASAADANNTTTPPKTNTPANPPSGEQAKADATSADGAAADATAAAPNSPAQDDDLNDRVEKRVREILAEERQTEERTAAERAAHEAWIGRNAPHLAGTKFGDRLFANARTDKEREAVVQEFEQWAKSRGFKAPDMGRTPDLEGGRSPAPGDPQSDRVAAANKALDEIGPRRL